MSQTGTTPPRERVIRRPVVSDMDGTREGGLVFCIVLICGFVAASFVHEAALTSFWVWFGLLSMSVAVAVNVQRLLARLNGVATDDDDDDQSADYRL